MLLHLYNTFVVTVTSDVVLKANHMTDSDKTKQYR